MPLTQVVITKVMQVESIQLGDELNNKSVSEPQLREGRLNFQAWENEGIVEIMNSFIKKENIKTKVLFQTVDQFHFGPGESVLHAGADT